MHISDTKNNVKTEPYQAEAMRFDSSSVVNSRHAPLWSHGSLPLQTSLKINTPGDKYEREADRVAEQVMRMPEPILQRESCSCGKPMGPDGECTACKRKKLGIQRLASSDAPHTAAPPIVNQVLQQPGRPLDGATRNFMESRFGQDFGHVRVHTDGKAATSADAINARAYTVGANLVFGVNQYAPSQADGKHLIAHELTHVIQQGLSGIGIQRDCADDQRRCRNFMNWSDGGHWIGSGSEPDCNCDNTFEDSRAACGNRLNWSDGGYWIGSGPEPDCSLSSTLHTDLTLTYTFPTNECVQQFNSGRNTIGTHVSTGAGIITGVITAAAHPAVGIIAGATVNELIGAIPQTPIGVGYRWIRVMTLTYTRSAHPWGVNRMTMGVDSSVVNERNELVEGFSYFYEIPQDVAVQMGPLLSGRQPDQSIIVRCPAANVLSY